MKEIYLLLSLLFLQGRAQVNFTPLNVPTSQTLRGIHFSDSLTGYSCGDNGNIVKTMDGGSSWISLTSNTTDDLWDVKTIPGTSGLGAIIVGDNNTVLKTTDGGTNWSSLSIPFQSGSFVFGVQCLDSLTYFACGGDYATFSGAILKTTNGGNTWTKNAVSGTFFLDKIFMQSNSKGFAVGTNNSFSNGSIRKTVNNAGWTTAKTSGSLITNVWCPSGTVAVAVGLQGQIWKSSDDGGTWNSTAVNQTDLYGIQFRDSVNGFICGGSTSESIIFSTNNAGDTWTANTTYTFTGALLSMSIVQNNIYMAGGLGTIIKARLPAPPTSTIATGIAKTKSFATVNIYGDVLNKRVIVKISDDILTTSLRLIITDELGNSVITKAITTGSSEISTNNFTPGIYYYQLASSNYTYKTGKVLIY